MALGERVRLVRVRAQMSTRDLAKRVGVSATAISKYERGTAYPRQSTLLRLARALSVKVEFFFRDVKVDTISPAYRKDSSLGKRAQESIEATITEVLERRLAIEDVLPNSSARKHSLPVYDVTSPGEADEAAGSLRDAWDLGSDPLDDLTGRLENHGVVVVLVDDGPTGFDGFSCWVNESVPVIAVSSHIPGDRERFSLAHELGHLVMRVPEDINPEPLAHRFAAALLVPRQAALAELGTKRSNLSLNELLLLKQEYGISIQAWVRRARDLDIIDQDVYSGMFRRLAQLGFRRQEPGEVKKEQPRYFELLVHQALSERLITPSYAATLLQEGKDTGFGESDQVDLSATASQLLELYGSNPELTSFANAELGAGDDM